MPFDKMRKGFLIIGFTGPMRSGCTTAAEYLYKDLSHSVSDTRKLLSKEQSKIEKQYKHINSLKESNSDYDKLWRERKTLLDLLKDRHFGSTLIKYEEDKPKYVSMTNMLLKTAVEKWAEGKSDVVAKIEDKTKKRTSD